LVRQTFPLQFSLRLGAWGVYPGEDVALRQKQTVSVQNVMSALPLTADISSALADVRFVPIADIALEIADEAALDIQRQWWGQRRARPCHPVFFDLIEKPRMKAACKHPLDATAAVRSGM
jgi:hypothetical protein